MTDRVNPYSSGPAADAKRLVEALENADPEAPVGRVRAKFYVAGVNLQTWGATIVLQAVSRGARNADWSSATPSGKIELTVTNPAAIEQYVRALKHRGGPEFFVDFTHAPLAWPEDGHRFVATPEGHYNYPRCAECACPEDEHVKKDERGA